MKPIKRQYQLFFKRKKNKLNTVCLCRACMPSLKLFIWLENIFASLLHIETRIFIYVTASMRKRTDKAVLQFYHWVYQEKCYRFTKHYWTFIENKSKVWRRMSQCIPHTLFTQNDPGIRQWTIEFLPYLFFLFQEGEIFVPHHPSSNSSYIFSISFPRYS